MRFAVVALLAGCTSGLGDGDLIPACTDCTSPGALVTGRYFENSYCAANTSGAIVCEHDNDPAIEFLDPMLKTTTTVVDGVASGAYTFDEAGEAVVLTPGKLVVVHPDQSVTSTSNPLDTSETAGLLATDGTAAMLNITNTTTSEIGQINAIDLANGALRWTKMLPAMTGVAATPDGGLVLVGTFTGALDLGGGIAPISSATQAGWIARFDVATGTPTWLHGLAGAGSGTSAITSVASGPGGEIAIAGTWNGGPTTLDDLTLPSIPSGATQQFIALIESTGDKVRWSHTLGVVGSTNDDTRMAVKTDGTDIFTAGNYIGHPSLGPTLPEYSVNHAFVAHFTPTALAWAYDVGGHDGLTGAGILSLVDGSSGASSILAVFAMNVDTAASAEDSSFSYGFTYRDVDVTVATNGVLLVRLNP